MNKFGMLFVMIISMITIFSGQQEAEAAVDFSRGVHLSANTKAVGENNRMSSFLHSDNLLEGTSYSGSFSSFDAQANLRSIKLVYTINGMTFTMEGTIVAPTMPFDGQLLSYKINKVNGRQPVFDTRVTVNNTPTVGRQVSLYTRNSIVPNWGALPNVQNYSKLVIYGGLISVIVVE